MGTVQLRLVHGGRDRAESRRAEPAPSSTPSATSKRAQIVDSALRVVARRGMAGTTVDDFAREAGCSRATMYRVFPGGKEQLLAEVASTEVSRFFTALAVRMGECSNVEDVLVAGVSEAATLISQHGALEYLRGHEPEVILPHLAFAHMDEVLASASAFLAPFLGRFVDHDEALRVAEWATRIVISYMACPAAGVDISDPGQARRLVRRFVLPGVRALQVVDPPSTSLDGVSSGSVHALRGPLSSPHSVRNNKGEDHE